MNEPRPQAVPEKRAELISHLQQMDSQDFEEFLADLWAHQGWETRVTPRSKDAGVDVIATRELPLSLKIVIQAKRYSPKSNVSSTEIQQYGSLLRQEENVDAVAVATTSGFTEQAQQAADALNVKLVNVNDLCEIIEDTDAYGLLEPYIDEPFTFTEEETAEDVIFDKIKLGNKTRSELEKHIYDGYGLFDTIPAEQYAGDETVYLVHSSSASPVWTKNGDSKSLDFDTETTEQGPPVYLHATSRGIWIFARNLDSDTQFFTDYEAVAEVRSNSVLFGSSESVIFDLGDKGTFTYKFRSMAEEVRDQFERIIMEQTGATLTL